MHSPEIIKEACPWFFEMRELIAERPNQVPVGLGNSETDFDMSIMTGGSSQPNSEFAFDDMGNDDTPEVSEGPDELDRDDTSDLDSAGLIDTNTIRPSKRKASSEKADKSSTTSKTGPQPGSSKPVARVPKNTVKRQKKDEFAEIAQAEEVTRQKELEVAKAKMEKDTARAKAKLAKLELEKEKLAYARERRQEKVAMRMHFMGGRNQQHGFPTNPDFVMHRPFAANSPAHSSTFSSHPSSTEFLSGSHHGLPYSSPSAYYRAPSSSPGENAAAGPSSGIFLPENLHSNMFIPEVEENATPFIDGRQLSEAQ
jgi:hypothetical protein